ncbi:MAG: response regulator transcription factor [Chloroflexi bacterium]|nr:response regulator transcription factor [Chloroflexota bacterium]
MQDDFRGPIWREASALRPTERPRRIQHRDLIVDLDEHRVHVRNVEVHLTPTEPLTPTQDLLGPALDWMPEAATCSRWFDVKSLPWSV